MYKKINQKKAVFYMLWKAYKNNPDEFIPAWRFIGELYISEINEWFFMSYKCPANGIDIYFKNEGMIERRITTGKTGAKYYEYRIVDIDKLKDDDLKEFINVLEAIEI